MKFIDMDIYLIDHNHSCTKIWKYFLDASNFVLTLFYQKKLHIKYILIDKCFTHL